MGGDQHGVSNTLSGSVTGSVVQAGGIGQVVISAPVEDGAPAPRQLPAPVRDFTCRERQVAALDSVLPSDATAHSTVAVLDGTGGVGKPPWSPTGHTESRASSPTARCS